MTWGGVGQFWTIGRYGLTKMEDNKQGQFVMSELEIFRRSAVGGILQCLALGMREGFDSICQRMCKAWEASAELCQRQPSEALVYRTPRLPSLLSDLLQAIWVI